MVTGSIGCATCSSQRTNTPSSTAATAKPPNVWADSQPHSGAWMIVYTRALIAAIDRAAPMLSRRGASRSRDSGTSRQAARATMTRLPDASLQCRPALKRLLPTKGRQFAVQRATRHRAGLARTPDVLVLTPRRYAVGQWRSGDWHGSGPSVAPRTVLVRGVGRGDCWFGDRGVAGVGSGAAGRRVAGGASWRGHGVRSRRRRRGACRAPSRLGSPVAAWVVVGLPTADTPEALYRGGAVDVDGDAGRLRVCDAGAGAARAQGDDAGGSVSALRAGPDRSGLGRARPAGAMTLSRPAQRFLGRIGPVGCGLMVVDASRAV